jgi:mycothiol system anti-sigma-R factor
MMKGCDDYHAKIQLYLDRQLSSQEVHLVRAHLEECVTCKKDFEEERNLSMLLSRSRPLYSAPKALRTRILQIISKSKQV